MDLTEDKTEQLRKIYADNKFVNYLDMKIEKVASGYAKMSMYVDYEKHTNLHRALHGGGLISLADTAMGIACVSTGKKVVTLAMTTNFISVIEAGETAIATAKIIHQGRRTIVAEGIVENLEGKLIGKLQATFFVIGEISLD